MNDTARAVVQLEGVYFAYNRFAESESPTVKPWALEDIHLQLLPGTWLAVAGSNGSGKSTLARLIAGLHHPNRGSIHVCGVSTIAPEFHPAQIGIGYLAQQPEEHVVGLTVWDDVAFGLVNRGLHADEIEGRVKEALAAVDLSHLPADKSTLHLSGGELQRVALAGVLALRPSLLILDEPTAACHPSLRRAIRAAVRNYMKHYNAAVLWVTHDPEEIAAADAVIVLADGSIVFRGTPAELAEEQSRGRRWDLAPLEHQGLDHFDLGAAAMRDDREIALAMKGVGFAYDASERRVLKDVDLRVHRGEIVTLIGPSGAGKSTLIHLASMLEARHEGSVTVLGEHVPSAATRSEQRKRQAIVERIRPRVAVAFQQPEQQLFGVTVRDDFVFGLRHLGIDPEEWAERIETAIAAVGLNETILDRSPFELSGGERRRVAIALCLSQQPELLLLDEPTAGMDYPSVTALLHAIEEQNADHQTSVFVATHDPAVVSRWHRRVLRLQAGCIVEEREGHAHSDVPYRQADDNHGEANDGTQCDSFVLSDGHDFENTSWLKGVDSRVRFVGAAVAAASIATVRTGFALASAACLVALWFVLAAYPLRSAVAIARSLWPFLLAAIVFAGLQWSGGLTVSMEGLSEGTILALRILLLVLSVSWLTHVGGVGEMLWSLSSLFAPLRRIGIPVSALVGAAVIAIRMIPLLGEEASRIRRAQIARGVNRIKGWRGHWLRVVSLVIPLSASLFRRAERLGEALHLRGFQDGSQFAVRAAARGGYKNIVFLCLALAGAAAIVMAN